MTQSLSDAFALPPVSAPVVILSPEQTRAKIVELRDADGESLGFLYRAAGTSVYYSPEYIAELRRRSASGERGRTLREVLDSVAERMGRRDKNNSPG